MKLGVYVLGVAAIAAGIVNLIWGDFEKAHQPIQAWGDNLSGRGLFADIVGVVLVLGGAAIMRRQSRQIGAVLVGFAYFIFAIFWAPRLYTATSILGPRGTSGAAAGVGLELIIIAAAAILYASEAPPGSPWATRTTNTARWMFGLSTVAFGLAHLANIADNAPLVPKWIPLGGNFWVTLTGVCFILAGVGILSGFLDVLAARLLTIMFAVFSVLALAPLIAAYPYAEGSWGTNAYNLAAIGATWVLADCLANRSELGLQKAHVPRVS
jgi:hypothetical protein